MVTELGAKNWAKRLCREKDGICPLTSESAKIREYKGKKEFRGQVIQACPRRRADPEAHLAEFMQGTCPHTWSGSITSTS